MADRSEPSASIRYRQRDRNFGRKGGATLDNSNRFKAKGGRRVQGDKGEGLPGNGAKGSRAPGKRPTFDGKGNAKGKRKWRPNPDQKLFKGSVKEGQGFAFWRKEKVQLEYKKLLRKQKKANTKEVSYSDHYPEHLKHLYLAEERTLEQQEKLSRRKNEPSEMDGEEKVIPKKTFKRKTSNQKAKEEYERVQQARAKKREEAENNRKKREEALRIYQEKRMEAYKVLSSKTKKGQPNFNVQMEYLLKKIQSTS